MPNNLNITDGSQTITPAGVTLPFRPGVHVFFQPQKDDAGIFYLNIHMTDNEGGVLRLTLTRGTLENLSIQLTSYAKTL